MELDIIELLLEGKYGLEFQVYCERYFDAIYGPTFHRVAHNGNKGDGGKDGYIYGTEEYFAISSRGDVEQKLKQDFINCVIKNFGVKIFYYVTNRISTSEEIDEANKLRRNNPDIRIIIITHKHIALELFEMPKRKIQTILCRTVDFSDDDTIYFKADEDKKVSRTLLESLKESYPYYLGNAIFVLMVVGILCWLFPDERALNIFLISSLCIVLLFVIFCKKRFQTPKFTHKILHLIMGEKFPVGREVLFDEDLHTTILRNEGWHFTFNKRSADCIKKGCSGKVYLYKSEKYPFIGRCEVDHISHVYKVDSNFYGDLL